MKLRLHILPLCEVRSLFGVMTFVQHRKCILAARNQLNLGEKNSWPLLFLRFGLPKPCYARIWQLSNLRKSNFGREFFSLRATWFWLLRTFILICKKLRRWSRWKFLTTITDLTALDTFHGLISTSSVEQLLWMTGKLWYYHWKCFLHTGCLCPTLLWFTL